MDALVKIGNVRAIEPLTALLDDKNTSKYADKTIGDLAKDAIENIKSAQKEKKKE